MSALLAGDEVAAHQLALEAAAGAGQVLALTQAGGSVTHLPSHVHVVDVEERLAPLADVIQFPPKFIEVDDTDGPHHLGDA